MQKGSVLPFILIIVVLVLAAGIATYSSSYFLKQTKPLTQVVTAPATPQLKIYTNSSLGFEFQDVGLTVQQDSEEEFNQRGNGNFRKNFAYYVTYQPAEVLGIVAVLDEQKSYETNTLTIWVFDNPDNLTIEKWYEKYWYYPFVWGDYTSRRDNVAPVKEATISGILAKSGIVTYRAGEPKFVYLSKNGKMYLFRVIGEAGDKILESFKFLN